MKIAISSRKLFLLAFLIVVITNIIVLSGVVFNRSAEPYREIILMERELTPQYRVHKDNSGLSLQLTWRVLDINGHKGYSYYSRQPAWLNREKLEELGFNIIADYLNSDIDARLYKKPVAKEVFIVLENNGEAYQESLTRAQIYLEEKKVLLSSNSGDKRLNKNVKEAQRRLERERISKSRLFAIDAGIDSEWLREKYSDQTRFIIAKGLVEPRYNYQKKGVTGYIKKLSVENIHVALKHRQLLDPVLLKNISKQNVNVSSRYKVVLAYGSRYEPWIVAASPVE